MSLTWKNLVVETIRSPEEAARMIMALKIGRRDIWLGVAAVAVINAVFSGLLDLLTPPPPPGSEAALLLSLSPVGQTLLVGVMVVMLAYFLTWAGRPFGGVASSDDMMKLMVWVQLVAMLLQLASMVVLFAVPILGVLAFLVTLLVILRVMICFIKKAHGFEGFGPAALVLVAGIVGMIVGLSLILMVTGAGMMGVQTGV